MACLFLLPAAATAQGGLGVGPRFSFVNSNVVDISSERVRYFGGSLRLRSSAKTTIELSADYRSLTNELGTERTRDLPLQASLLMYLGRSAVSPYVLGGVGWYSLKTERYSGDTVLSDESVNRMGYHAGVGGDLRVTSRASVHLDYRYTFIHFGEEEAATGAPGAIPLPFTQGLQEKLRLSHEGSMLTTGVTFYF
jgi:opacity protein-like surface antigen